MYYFWPLESAHIVPWKKQEHVVNLKKKKVIEIKKKN